MSRRSESTLVPRNGNTLVVGIVARISGCGTQKEVSLDDQVDHGKEEVGELYKGPCKYIIVATKGKGERLDRPELAKVEKLFRSRQLDLCVMEDVGRLVRGAEAVRLFGIAVDHGTRCIAPNDCVDTAEETWEEDLMSACRDHTANQSHTSKRIKHKLMTRFKRSGQITPRPIAGYIKPEGAKSFADWRKDEAATPIIQEGLRILKQTLLGPPVADYFNAQDFEPGSARRTRKKWNGTMVLQYYRNPILKGMPKRGSRHTIKHHETGRRVSVFNPKGPAYRHEPHLAHLDPAEFDEVVALLDAKNKYYARAGSSEQDPRFRIPRKQTRSFGQHARCWYCGRHYVWGANGQADGLMCSGAREWRCWNSFGFNGPLAATLIVEAILARLDRVEGVDQQFRDLVRNAQSSDANSLQARWSKLTRDEASLARERENLLAAIAQYGPRPMIQQKLAEIEQREKCLVGERFYLETAPERELELPESALDLKSIIQAEFKRLAVDSFEFGELIRQLVPDVHVYLVRHIRGGHLLPRAKVRLNLLGSFGDGDAVPGLRELLDEDLTIDIFDPTRKEKIRLDAARLAADGLSQSEIAAKLPGRIHQVEVWEALKCHRRMQELGLSNPYLLVEEPPDDYTKLRRHKNAHYSFEMLEGYERPPL